MLKKTIQYRDLDGNVVVDDFYFHLTKADLAEMEFSEPGGMQAKLESVVKSGNGNEIIALFKELIGRAYGKRGEDGKRFIKTPQLWLEFLQTDAYSELFLELVTNAEAGAAFIRGIMPADLSAKLDAGEQIVELPKAQSTEDNRPDWLKEGRAPTDQELLGSPREYLSDAFRLKMEAAKS